MRLTFLITCLFIMPFCYSQQPPAVPVIEWERALGGSNGEEANDLLAEPNGNIVAVGFANSIDGDVTGNHGLSDGWFVKLDSTGNTLFTKCLGGSAIDELTMVLAAPGSGNICIGYSYSGDMDLPGNNGDADAWMVKLSAAGDIEWSRHYGDSLSNKFLSAVVLHDGSIAAIIQTTNGSGPVSTVQQSVVKLDALGNILWQTVVNTGNSIVETGDHKLLTASGLLIDATTGNTTPVTWNIPGNVVVLKKINNRIYAAAKNGLQNLAGYLEEGAVFNYVSQVWAVDYDSNGGEGGIFNTVYTPSVRGLAYLPASAVYVVTGTQTNFTRGGVFEYGMINTGGTVSIFPGMYADVDRLFAVTALNNGDEFVCAGRKFTGQTKFWIAKYAVNNVIRGHVFYDLNNNNVQDAGEPPFNNINIRSSRYRQDIINKTAAGMYSNFVDTGFYTTAPILAHLPYYTASPASDTVTFSSFKNISVQNFAIQKIADARDYAVSLAAYTPARPGFHVLYKITCSNRGTDTLSNKPILFIKDSRLQLVQTQPLFDSIAGDTLYWNLNGLVPGEERDLLVDMTVGTSIPVSIGNVLISYAVVDSNGDADTVNNTDSLQQQVTGSFDPNDKTEIHGDYISKAEVENGQYLEYTIRFQNTGTDTAFTVYIRDTLDSRLQWSSAEAISASHPYSIRVKDGRYVECVFQNILLADSNRNEPASHGYITYRIRPKINLSIGDIIRNSASIYFDFNAPIKTNTVKTTVVKTTAIWTGAVDSLWDNPGNWNINLLPDAETAVIIPANVPHYPLVNVQATCYVLRVDKNARIDIGDGFGLDITGK